MTSLHTYADLMGNFVVSPLLSSSGLDILGIFESIVLCFALVFFFPPTRLFGSSCWRSLVRLFALLFGVLSPILRTTWTTAAAQRLSLQEGEAEAPHPIWRQQAVGAIAAVAAVALVV